MTEEINSGRQKPPLDTFTQKSAGGETLENFKNPLVNKKSETPLDSRLAAFRILKSILVNGHVLDQSIKRNPIFLQFSPQDRAFIFRMVTTCLRYQFILDALIQKFLSNQNTFKNVESGSQKHDLQICMRIGVTQILLMQVPDYAAVNTTLNLLTILNLFNFKGLCNAVLRKITREGEKVMNEIDYPKLAVSSWLWQDWVKSYGEETTRAMATMVLQDPPLDFSIKLNLHQPDYTEILNWQAAILGCHILPQGTLRRSESGMVESFAGYEDGDWWIQDAAASVPALLFGDIRGKTALDMCAAPGGKTAQLCVGGAIVTALEWSQARIKTLGVNMERLGLSPEVIESDANKWCLDPSNTREFDCILLDAPCSSTGTLRRNPDIKVLKQKNDVEKLIPVQRRLLESAAKRLKVGGTLVYCICSLQTAEGTEQIDWFVDAFPNFIRKPLSISEVWDSPEFLTPKGDVLILPSHWPEGGGMDGFFAARLERID